VGIGVAWRRRGNQGIEEACNYMGVAGLIFNPLPGDNRNRSPPICGAGCRYALENLYGCGL